MEQIQINPSTFGILTLLLNGIGAAIKASPDIPNHYIPFILMLAGGLSNATMSGWTGPNVIVGIVAAFSANSLHQVARSAVEAVKKPEDKP